MAEFKMPKYVYKGKHLSLDECYQEVAELSYQSPVNIVYQGFHSQLEGDIYQAIQSYGVHVDKDELVKALQYDRDQYKKGFADGCRDRRRELEKEIAREIFEEIEKVREDCTLTVDGRGYFQLTKFEKNIAELKKKYTEDME